MNKRLQTTKLDQNGFASLIVGLILVLVLSLLTVGFARLVDSEQQQTLDKQLSTQAFYAAESGVNYALQLIQAGTAVPATQNCTTIMGMGGLPQAIGNPSLNVATTCLLINDHPPSLDFSDISNQSTVEQFSSYDPSNGSSPNVSSITISWQCVPSGGGDCTFPTGTGALPAANAWLDPTGTQATTGILEASITPLSNLTQTALTNSTFTALLYPHNYAGGGNAPTSTAANNGISGEIVLTQCSATNHSGTDACTAIINLPSNPANHFLLRLRSIYGNDSTATISINNGALEFQNGQALIDSTGKAQNVLKRIQEHVPLNNGGQFPNTLDANSICKIMDVGPNFSQIDPSINDDGTCNLVTSAASPVPPGSGNALIGATTCDPVAGCPPVHGDSYHFNSAFVNHSVNTSPTKSCTWTIDNVTLGTQISSQFYSSGSDLPCETWPGTGSQVGLIQVDISATPEAVALNAEYPAPLLCTTETSKKITIKATLTLDLANGLHPTNTTIAYLPRCY